MRFGIIPPYGGDFDRVVSEPRPVQRGGVPIVIGGHSSAAARRAGRLGDGFYPLGVSPERLAELRRIMDDAARACARDPAAIELTCLGTPDRESAELSARLGVHRMVIGAWAPDLDDGRRALDRFRTEVMERFV